MHGVMSLPLSPPQAVAAAAAGQPLPSGADVSDGGRALTLRSASALASAYCRLRDRHAPLFSTLSAWAKVGLLRGLLIGASRG